jgi:hypothetical protein
MGVTNSTLDNNRHPEVGTIVAEYKIPGVKSSACSGTLISPTVFLTAGHCIFLLQNMFGVTQVWVTFDSVFSSDTPNLYSGTMHLNPLFPGRGASDPEDLGVIVLDRPVVGLTPAALPPLGLLDRMFAGGLTNTLFTIVGYGATDTVFGGGPPDPSEGEGTRRFATEGFLALNPDLLRLNQNTIFGYGGSNHGDSGGPNFFGSGASETNTIAAITIAGDTWGNELNIAYRLDTPEARAFLQQFPVFLP